MSTGETPAGAPGGDRRRRGRRVPGPPGAPSRADGVVAAASEVVGGPAGEHLAARTTRGVVASGLLGAAPLLSVAACLTTALALATRVHCRRTGWASPDQFVHACYSDVPTLVGSPAGVAGQPPGTAVLLRLLAAVGSTGTVDPRMAFDASVLFAAVCLIVGTVCLLRISPVRRWDAALLALCPAVVTAGLVSVDLAAVAALSGALLAWSRGRHLAAGVLVGAAASVRPVVAVVLVALWLVALVREPDAPVASGPGSGGGPGGGPGGGGSTGAAQERAGAWVPAALATVGAVAAGAVLTLLARIGSSTLTGGSRWVDWGSGAGYGSLWLVPSLAGRALSARATELLSALALVVVLLTAVAVAARTAAASRGGRPHLPTVALVLLAGALALGPSVPVQATLVVIPLAALAAPRWRDHLVWALAEVVYATVTWLYLYEQQSSDHRGAPGWMYAVVLVARLAALGWLVAAAVRRPGHGGLDPLVPAAAQAGAADDPADPADPALRGPVDSRTGWSARPGSLDRVLAGPPPRPWWGPAPAGTTLDPPVTERP